jgi:multidrug efflux pump subunit AcrB
LEEAYRRTLVRALRKKNPYLLFFGTVGLLIFSFMLLGIFPPKTLFFPENQPAQVIIYAERPIGSDIESINTITEQLEEEVLRIISRYQDTVVTTEGDTLTQNWLVKSVIAQVGEGTSNPNEGPSMAQTPNKSKITVAFVEFKYRRGLRTSDILNEIRDNLGDYPGVSVVVDKDSQGPPTGAPINIEIAGDNYSELLREAEAMRAFLNERNVPGVEELKLDVESGKPEMPIVIDREKARRFGVSTYMIGDAMRTALFGKEVSTYKDGEDDYPIVVRFKDSNRYDIDALMNQRITFRNQSTGRIAQVPISAVAHTEKSSTFSAVKRKDLERVITLSSNIIEGYNPTETVNQIKESLMGYEVPKGIEYAFTGEQEEQAKELAFLSRALLIAVFLIFLILVSQFNSAFLPVIILVSVILSLIGVFLGLIAFQMEFVIMMTMIGIISLAGIVVNNAIVLIDYTNLMQTRRAIDLGLSPRDKLPIGEVRHAIIEAGARRLRPVLLTAITTILGLIPLATGMNINFYSLFSRYDAEIYFGGDNVIFWGPMSWTIIFGLTFATFLTLVVVPVMYYLIQRLIYRVRFPHLLKG